MCNTITHLNNLGARIIAEKDMEKRKRSGCKPTRRLTKRKEVINQVFSESNEFGEDIVLFVLNRSAHVARFIHRQADNVCVAHCGYIVSTRLGSLVVVFTLRLLFLLGF